MTRVSPRCLLPRLKTFSGVCRSIAESVTSGDSTSERERTRTAGSPSIGLVSNGYPPRHKGGAENYVRELAQRLNERGFDIFVVTTVKSARDERLTTPITRDGVDVYRVSPHNQFYPLVDEDAGIRDRLLWQARCFLDPRPALKARRIIERRNPAVVHLNQWHLFHYPLVRLLDDWELVYTLHHRAMLPPRSVPSLADPMWGILATLIGLRNVSHVIAPSRDLLRQCIDVGIFSPENTSMHCVRLAAEAPDGAHNGRSDTDSVDVLFVGNLTERKGIRTLLNAAQRLDGKFRISIAGFGELADEVRAVADEEETVSFHGFVSETEKERLLQRADVLVVPSTTWDNSPVVIYEAFSHGVPVIGSDIGGIPELIETNEAGVTTRPGDEAALTEAIRRLERNPELLETLKRNALLAGEKYTWDQHMTDILDVYRKASDRSVVPKQPVRPDDGFDSSDR